MKSLSVLIFEDNALLRESISSLITAKQEMTLLGAFENVLTVKEQVNNHKPDLILMDIDMPAEVVLKL
jgi:DNA-binding NarL/FixJ family response regulator